MFSVTVGEGEESGEGVRKGSKAQEDAKPGEPLEKPSSKISSRERVLPQMEPEVEPVFYMSEMKVRVTRSLSRDQTHHLQRHLQ